jgi:hypothetical protein
MEQHTAKAGNTEQRIANTRNMEQHTAKAGNTEQHIGTTEGMEEHIAHTGNTEYTDKTRNTEYTSNSMRLSPLSVANNHSASQESPRQLWNPRMYLCISALVRA